MSTLTMQRVTDGVLESADTARLSIMNTAGTLIVNNVTVAPTSAGVYVYDISSLTNGNYTAYWTFEVSGQQNDSVTQAFTVESPVSFPQGLMLMEIEQRVARRVGPYRKLRVKVGSTVNSLIVAKMQSRLNIGDYEEMYILRRGRKIDGSLVTNFNEDDRIRQIETYTATTGTFSPDRDWSVAPATDEEIELHSLEPDDELRDAVKLGLDECYFWDTVITSTTTYLREVNLTAIAPWITRPAQVRGVTYGRASYLDEKAPWFHAYQLGADVWLQSAVPTVGNMRIMALRPHSTFVNGELSAGPNGDYDILNVPADYAVAAGARSIWMNYPERVMPFSALELRPKREEIMADFQMKSLRVVMEGPPEIIQNRFQQDDIFESMQIGNG